MAEEEQVTRAPVTRCQHCPTIIEKVIGNNEWWRGKDGQVICDTTHLSMLHKPMPRVSA